MNSKADLVSLGDACTPFPKLFFSQASNGVLKYSSRTFHLKCYSSSVECTVGWIYGLMGFPSIWWISLECVMGCSLNHLNPVLLLLEMIWPPTCTLTLI